jgi:hypothetical protein
MFGLVAFYRGRHIFAALPRSRAVETPNSFLVKLPGVESERVRKASGPGAGWVTFTMEAPTDITEALRWLERAYRMARTRSRARSR